ncbi:hypothetical protein EYC84_000452 [Monilinia fructicola]|uniref:Uncharacterized protein n=1 Tax=Monilinia fructicola TaxID=38448 RepID=A0A5M9JSQ4_MONFR|nr:hypothetical protein EYC84_000452 [Monilinia fructicola]
MILPPPKPPVKWRNCDEVKCTMNFPPPGLRRVCSNPAGLHLSSCLTLFYSTPDCHLLLNLKLLVPDHARELAAQAGRGREFADLNVCDELAE